MKGLLFGGCSFTWGQGLYFYSSLNRLVYPENEFTYNRNEINDAHIKFKDSIRYPRLVANHFNTFEAFKTVNGGSEDETFDFFKNIFTDPKKQRLLDHVLYERYEYDDFSFIIIQLSQINRNKFYFELNGEMCITNASPTASHQDMSKLLKWMEVNNKTYEDWMDELKKQQTDRLLKELTFYESKGIKTLLLSWEVDIMDVIKNNDYLSSRLIQLEYENEKFETIFDLQEKYKHMKIKHDYDFFGSNPPEDHHPSKLCHKVIADSIINHIEKNYL